MSEIPLHIIVGEPRILDIDLAIALGMSRPLNIRTGLIKMLDNVLASCGPVYRNDGACYLNEAQAHAICNFSTGRKALLADRAASQAFEKFRREVIAQITAVDALRMALAPFDDRLGNDRQARVVEALRSRLRQLERPRKYTRRMRARHRLPG